MTLQRILTTLTLLVAGTVAWAQGPEEQAQFLVVIHSSVGESSLTKKEVSDLFLGRTLAWRDGEPVAPVDLASDSPVRSSFSEAIHGRKVSAVKSYWQRQIFSGRAVPPPERESDEQVVQYVRGTPGAIGYVSADASTDGIRVLKLRD